MSFRSLLTHRATLMTTETTVVDGVQSYVWVPVKSNVRCRLDLQYIRSGKDPQWTPEAGRPVDRAGVAFFESGEPVKVGQRLVITKGPIGTYLVGGDDLGAVDEVFLGRGSHVHHLEVGVKEVPGPIAAAAS